MHVCLEGWFSRKSTGALRSQWISSNALELGFLLSMRCTKWMLEMNHGPLRSQQTLLPAEPSSQLLLEAGSDWCRDSDLAEVWMMGNDGGLGPTQDTYITPSKAQKTSQEMGWEQCKNLRRGR